MIKHIRTTSENPDFIKLVKQLDAYLAEIDGSEHAFYAQFNKIDMLKNAVVLYDDGKAVACGAMKEYQPGTMEVKRMYTEPARRGRGFAAQIVAELEKWAKELGYNKSVLETGIRQDAAISLYKRIGYKQIENYGQYAGVENSVCFEKDLG